VPSAAAAHDTVRDIGHRLGALRAAEGWTLDELARRSGVSRRMIIEIEKGRANPSVGTLLDLSVALKVPLSELVVDPTSRPYEVRAEADAVELWSSPAGGAGRLRVAVGSLELWSWTMAPGDEHGGPGHRRGTTELLSVAAGALTVAVGADELVVEAGASAWFDGSLPHRYRNDTDRAVQFWLVVDEPAS
jgi:transcriptional regulator with XRE-family HTH domain